VSLTLDQLRASVAAVMKDVKGAYARFEPPFDPERVDSRFSRLPDVHPVVAARLAAAYRSMADDLGDGGKAAVLVACGVVRAALDRLPPEGRANLAPAVDLAASHPAERVIKSARLVRDRATLLRAALAAAGGDAAISKALLEAFEKAGRNGVINVEIGTAGGSPGVTVIDGAEGVPDTDGWVETVAVRGRTEPETERLYLRACGALHATRWAVAGGVVPGGGTAYLLAAESDRESPDDTISGLATLAVSRGLSTPLSARAEAVGLHANTFVTSAPDAAAVSFDQSKPGFAPVGEGPLDAARVVAGAIREAGRTACDLLRLAL
jgi:hypothetical protein